MLKSFTVQSYRSFAEPTRIELRPITLLLGKNSSGKSSLTRLLPLLQQSMDRRTASPILWNSDDVDFGNISNALNSSSSNGELRISLTVGGDLYYQHAVSRSPYVWGLPTGLPKFPDVEFTAILTDDGGRTRYKSTILKIGDQRIEIFWGNQSISKITLNGLEINDYVNFADIYATTTNLFPIVGTRNISKRHTTGVHNTGPMAYFGAPPYQPVSGLFDYFVNKKTGFQKRSTVKRQLFFSPKSSIKSYISSLDHIVKSKLNHKDQLNDLSDALLINDFPSILSYLESIIRPTLDSAAYLGPARASGARFYRYQELSVDRIDPRGENLPMYLSSLNQYEMDSFNQLMDSACGFTVRVEHTGGHASILVGRDPDSMENLADVGFGFSQFLPIIAQIHAATQRSPSRPGASASSRPFIMAVEQPELHLHPAFQASLADMFVAAASPQLRRKSLFLIETHSESMIGRLAELVAQGKIKKDDIAIYFVEKDEDTKNSSVRTANFDSDGSIINWPIGFFSGSA